MKIRVLVLTLSAMAFLMASAFAQSYPERSMQWIVPAPAGGGTDTSARKLALLVEKDLGQSIAILNIAGGGGSVGITQFIQARPDGYTLAAVWNGALTTIPNVQPVKYSPDDYRPIISTSETAYVMCVGPDFPAETGQEFLEAIKKNPGKYTYGNDGFGGTMHLAAERLFRAYGVSATPVPFGGASETLKNFLGGHIDIYGGSIAPIRAYVKNGKAKCLIVTSEKPVPALPKAASMSDLGKPKLATSLWRLVLGPKNMTDKQVKIIADSIGKAMHDKDYIAFLAKRGEWPAVYRGKALEQRIKVEFEALGKVAKALGLKKD